MVSPWRLLCSRKNNLHNPTNVICIDTEAPFPVLYPLTLCRELVFVVVVLYFVVLFLFVCLFVFFLFFVFLLFFFFFFGGGGGGRKALVFRKKNTAV